MGTALGTILGSQLGGFLYLKYRNQTTCDIIAIMSFSMAAFYFMMNIWPAFLFPKKQD